MMTESKEASEETKLTVGGEDVNKQNATVESECCNIDLINRDPNAINGHLKVEFDEIFAEPHETIFSFDFAWKLSFLVFRLTKLWCYRISTLILSIPLSFCWGVSFACLSVCTIWCYMPCMRALHIKLFCCKRVYEVIMETFCAPFFDAIGRLLSHIKITITHTNK